MNSFYVLFYKENDLYLSYNINYQIFKVNKMKKLLFLLLMVTSISISSCAQTSSNAKQDDKTAEMIFKETDHNFGTILYKGDGAFEFVFKNTGKIPLIITDVQSSCGCTTPEWNKEPILPSKSGKVKVVFDTQRIQPFVKTVKVFSNAKNSPVELIIRGEVKAPSGTSSNL